MDNGNLVYVFANEGKYNQIFDENGNILMNFDIINDVLEMYNEEGELIYKDNKGKIESIGHTSKENNGIYEFSKSGKLVIKYDSNKDVEEYYYSTGELMILRDNDKKENRYFYKNGSLFVVENDVDKETVVKTKDGRSLLLLDQKEENTAEFGYYNEDDTEIYFYFDKMEDIKKVD